jgi:hypothetical protein
MAAGGPDQPGVLWTGTLPGGLFRSGDRGDRWELVRPLWNVPEFGDCPPGSNSLVTHIDFKYDGTLSRMQ